MSETNQGNTPVLKLDFIKIEFKMYKLIFGISSYSKRGLREHEFHELEYFTWNSSSQKKKFKIFQYAITRLFKNQVLN